MAWDWSHSEEAYSNAYQNLEAKPIEWLAEVSAEWLATTRYDPETGELSEGHDWCQQRYAECEEAAYGMLVVYKGHIVDAIWERMSEARVCDNGGHNAWCCRDGCHTVSFDLEPAAESEK